MRRIQILRPPLQNLYFTHYDRKTLRSQLYTLSSYRPHTHTLQFPTRPALIRNGNINISIKFQVGAPAPGGQYAHYKEDLYLYGQRAFGMPPDRHYRMLHVAGEEQPPIVVLSVVVIEAEGLEAKDANGEL